MCLLSLRQVYFRLNTLRLCKNLINAVHSRQFAPFDAFPASQRVTYKYYTGRLAIFDEQYVRLLSCPQPLVAYHINGHALKGVRLVKDKVLTLPVPRGSRDAGVAKYLFRMMIY